MRQRAIFLAAAAALWTFPAAGQDKDWAKAKLEKSSRHGEYVQLNHDGRSLQAWVVYPEVSHKATAVIMIHEIFGLTDWARLAADEMAEAGYIAIAPDLVGPLREGQNMMQAVRALPAEQVLADLDAAADYVKKLPAANGKVAVAGFCWGGGKSFAYATHNKDLTAAFVFYGSAPEKSALSSIACPVYGFYGENDARITASVPATEKAMKQDGKSYDVVIYKGAGHGFMRAGEQPKASQANSKAREESWTRLKDILGKI
jgi:carboxymethylenebutenolidase